MVAALPMTRVAGVSGHSLLAEIGNTPLIFLERISATVPGIEIYAKAESLNPGGSVKDRPALNMILDGERTGKLTPGKIDPRFHQRQYRHRLRHDRGGSRVQGEACACPQMPRPSASGS